MCNSGCQMATELRKKEGHCGYLFYEAVVFWNKKLPLWLMGLQCSGKKEKHPSVQ